MLVNQNQPKKERGIMGEDLFFLKCPNCAKVTGNKMVKPEKAESDKVYFLCMNCLEMWNLSAEAFKFLVAMAVSRKRDIPLSEALEIVNEKMSVNRKDQEGGC
jgi:hypothetical protein